MGRLPVRYHAESDRETRNLDQYNCHKPCQMPLGGPLQDGDESNRVNDEESQKGNPEFRLPKVLFELYANTPNQEARPVAQCRPTPWNDNSRLYQDKNNHGESNKASKSNSDKF
jgi:hypothetical protein